MSINVFTSKEQLLSSSQRRADRIANVNRFLYRIIFHIQRHSFFQEIKVLCIIFGVRSQKLQKQNLKSYHLFSSLSLQIRRSTKTSVFFIQQLPKPTLPILPYYSYPQEKFSKTNSLSHQSLALRNKEQCHSSIYGMKIFIPFLPYLVFFKFQRHFLDAYSVLRSGTLIQKLLAQ